MTDTEPTTASIQDTAQAVAVVPKRRGRPPGLAKTGGRKKGTPNKTRVATVERIMKEADPLLFLCKVCRGDRLTAAPEHGAKRRSWVYPTVDQRLDAARILAKKVLPDLRSTELSGNPGNPLTVSINMTPHTPGGEGA
jgi:hypothetical protein